MSVCKHNDLIVQRNNGHRWVTCTECHVDFLPDESKPLTDEQQALLEAITQFKRPDTSPPRGGSQCDHQPCQDDP